MKRFLKLLAVVMAFALTMTATATAFAVDYSMDTSQGAFTTTFDKNFTVPTDTVVPNATFTYNIVGSTDGTTGSVINIEAGPTGAVVNPVSFTNSDDNSTGSVTKAVTVDLSGCEFTAPGVYRYKISEVNGGQAGVTYDTRADRYLDVYVVADANNVLSVQNYVLRNTADALVDGDDGAEYATDADTKSSSYTNAYAGYDLEFSKTITGNQADKNATFPFTLAITGATPGAYNITLADGSKSTITVAADGTYTGTYNLGDGDTIQVFGLTPGATYTITETNSADYAVSNATDNGAADADDEATGTMTADHSVAFTNERNGIIPTGVIMTVAPFAIGMLLFGAVIFFVISKRRREAY